MNMCGTGNREEDELLRLLRQGSITPEQAQDVGRDYGSLSIADFANLGAFAPETQRRSGRAAVRDAEIEQRANVAPTEDTVVRGTSRGGRAIGSKPGLFDVGITQKQGRVGRGRNKALVYGGKQNAESASSEQPAFMQLGRDVDIIGMDEAARTADKPRGLPTLEKDITDPDMSDDTVTADAEEVELDLEGMAPSPTLLQRIGNALKDNPELAASGAQLLGGLISNAAQNRAQRRADRTTDQRVARANLISAITGGRARPTVERAQADTGGFMSLDTLGKTLQGGGAAYKGELARQVAEDERERKAGLEKRNLDLKQRELDIKDFQAQSLDDFRKGKITTETGPADLSAVERRQVKELAGSIDVIDQFIKDFDNLEGEEDSFNRMFRGLSTNVPIFGAALSPKAQKFTDQRSILVGQVAKIINGGASGQISDFEQKLANEAVPDIRKMRDSGAYGRSKLTALKDLFELRRQAMMKGIDEPLHKFNAFYEITGAERKEGDEGAAEVTPESITGDQRSLLQRAREGDEEAIRQGRELGLF